MNLTTLREALDSAAGLLAADPVLRQQARRDAEFLLLQRLHISKAALMANPSREIGAEDLSAFEDDVARRLRHEPVQYIVGEQEFYGLPLFVTPAVLIPRPETEHLVETVLAWASEVEPKRIVDVGTGSGAIAIALAKHLPDVFVTAIDLSPEALAVAEENARRLGVRVRFLQSDLLDAVCGERFDAVVSNPPYVPGGDRALLAAEVREYEPEMALFAGETGMSVYERLVPQAYDVLETGGLLAMEFGYGQRDAMAALLEGWKNVRFVEDLQGIPRVAVAVRDSPRLPSVIP